MALELHAQRQSASTDIWLHEVRYQTLHSLSIGRVFESVTAEAKPVLSAAAQRRQKVQNM